MIKQLLFAAALLAPCIAHAANPSAPFSTQVVPAASDSIACDSGPKYTGAVSAPAQKAGFTRCLLNADFTNSFYNNPNTWLENCGAAPDSNNSIFRLRFANVGYPGASSLSVADAACNRMQMVSDNGTQVAHYWWQPSDGNAGYTLLSLNWPGDEWGGGPCGNNQGHGYSSSNSTSCVGGPYYTGLTDYNYYELTFRVLPASLNLSNYNGDSAAYDFWQDQCNGGGCNAWGYSASGSHEIDFFETHIGYQNGSPLHIWMYGFGSCTGAYPVGNPPTNCTNFDVTNYHTYGILTTNNGSGTAAQCLFIDGVQQINPCPTLTGYTNIANGKVMALWAATGQCFGNPPCMTTGTFDVYLKSARIWSCNNAYTTGCSGTLVTSALDEKPRFAWLKAIKGMLAKVISRAEAAEAPNDPFAHDINGFWYCPGGKLDNKVCMPPEFIDSEWWKRCLPGRSDCVQSETAFIGYIRGIPQRGYGYCYTLQPYTCAPDGKVPQ